MTYLLHADGSLPNLALMRLATYLRVTKGEPVRLIRGRNQRTLWDEPGPVYGSRIFSFTDPEPYEQEWGPIRWGGTGVSTTSTLREVAEIDWDAVAPDYSLYPGEARSIGFTQRGCRLRCSFCVVPRKEGRPESSGTIEDIWRGPGHPKKLLLLDNDFFGGPEWRDRTREIVEGGFKVCLTQGINIRKVGDEEAAALASMQYRNSDFNTRTLYTAWDNLGDERVFKEGVATLNRAGIPSRHLRVYMLIGFAPNETMEQILYRFNEMVALGCEPYPMAYDRTRPELRAFQRWAIRGLYRAIPWDQYRDPRKAVA